jgi:hypothetical protein
LYSWAKFSSSSRIDATLPQLNVHGQGEYDKDKGTEHNVDQASAKSTSKRKPGRRAGRHRVTLKYLPIAIVGGTPNGYNRLIKHQFVAFHCELVCSSDEVDGIIMREGLGDVRSEKEACSARGKTPTGDICNPKDFVRFCVADSLRARSKSC